MSRKFTETEKCHLISNKHHIMSYKKFEIEKPDDLCKKKKIDIKCDPEEKDIVEGHLKKEVGVFHMFIEIEFI